MKTYLLFGCLALSLAATAGALEPTPPTTGSLDRDIQGISTRLREAVNQIDDLQKRLDTVEKRLGETYRAPSPFDSVERRLGDLEKNVDNLKRR